ncbi:hypothetical protein DFH09DRAFT_162670 [Mycena vulgaris]|nr:hypothetical protein DFH09DRAFT_162670 [Mycena vulgaris]
MLQATHLGISFSLPAPTSHLGAGRATTSPLPDHAIVQSSQSLGTSRQPTETDLDLPGTDSPRSEQNHYLPWRELRQAPILHPVISGAVHENPYKTSRKRRNIGGLIIYFLLRIAYQIHRLPFQIPSHTVAIAPRTSPKHQRKHNLKQAGAQPIAS